MLFEEGGMTDTDFWVPPAKLDRLCALYVGVDLLDPTKPGLLRADAKPFPGAYTRKMPRESGGGGQASTLGDTVKFIQSFLPGGASLLNPDTIELMYRNQLATGMCVQFPNMPRFETKRFGLGSSVATGTTPWEPADVVGEVGWEGGGPGRNDLVDQPPYRHCRCVDDPAVLRFWHSLFVCVQGAGVQGSWVLIKAFVCYLQRCQFLSDAVARAKPF